MTDENNDENTLGSIKPHVPCIRVESMKEWFEERMTVENAYDPIELVVPEGVFWGVVAGSQNFGGIPVLQIWEVNGKPAKPGAYLIETYETDDVDRVRPFHSYGGFTWPRVQADEAPSEGVESTR